MSFYHPKVRYTREDDNKTNSILRYIGTRVLDNNKNFLCAITGQTGSGKSWAAGSICEMYSQMYGIPYDPQVHTFFSLKELLLLVNSNELDKKIQIGSILMFDESQIDVNARAWQSEANRIMAQLVSTFRNKRLVVLFPTPYLEFLDKQSRVLFHAQFEVLGFDKKTKNTTLKPRFLEYNPRIDDFYRKRLIVEHKLPEVEGFAKSYVQEWVIPKPSDAWVEIYEGKKKAFSVQLNAELLKKAQKEGENGEKVPEKSQSINDLHKVKEVYEQFGENYLILTEKLPHLGPTTLQRYVQILKKSLPHAISVTR